MAIQQLADLGDSAFGQQATPEEQQDALRELGDLAQDVARYQDARALLGEVPQQGHQVKARFGIQAVEGFIQNEQLRLVQQGLGQADALAHALGHARKGEVGAVRHAHRVEDPGHRPLQPLA